MCFKVHHKHTTPKTARKRIFVYKLGFLQKPINGKKALLSPHRGHLYVEGEKHELKRAVRWFQKGFDFKNYHRHIFIFHGSLAHSKTKKDFPTKVMIGTGFHSYSTMDIAQIESHLYHDKTTVVKMVIPVGALYYYNPITQEYVSNSLVWSD